MKGPIRASNDNHEPDMVEIVDDLGQGNHLESRCRER